MYTTKYRNCAPANRGNLSLEDFITRDFFGGMRSGINVPASNIKETNENYTIEMAAPGLEKTDFKIKLENNVLSISSDKKTEASNENERYTRREFQFNSFIRSFSLPETVNADAIAASYDNGVLCVVLPKRLEAEKAAGKQIVVA